ncbi:hypothetical protein PPL_08469 [Heterostelium album PN500]|uniref:Essential for reactive oxygen species protein n=1 Tax=Heterostelium pallidum (strain ATCC 26659 / Pp 5 / PN500) TaxID=670386 RepID=D3BIA1_HETP5|nr:hypothetical protein PPL_08469 [Heterostelium album PN500]EFA79001.1 hypothetical protein PPL_08469 [Heterostelium album PN500]|eukprot:XP_020431125.1 hypothetical protein PPL_08469 [Heterostelium album PN500]
MKITETSKERLKIEHSDRNKEWTLGFVIALVGFLPFFMHSEGWFLFCGKYLFLATFILMGLLNVRDEFNMTLDLQKKEITMNYRNIIDIIKRQPGMDLVFDLSRLTHAYVQEQVHEKKKLQKIFLMLDGSLSIPLSDTLYFDVKFADNIAGTINKWLKENKVGSRFTDTDSDEDGAQTTKRRLKNKY